MDAISQIPSFHTNEELCTLLLDAPSIESLSSFFPPVLRTCPSRIFWAVTSPETGGKEGEGTNRTTSSWTCIYGSVNSPMDPSWIVGSRTELMFSGFCDNVLARLRDRSSGQDFNRLTFL